MKYKELNLKLNIKFDLLRIRLRIELFFVGSTNYKRGAELNENRTVQGRHNPVNLRINFFPVLILDQFLLGSIVPI